MITNVGGNTGIVSRHDVEKHDAATPRLSARMKEFLRENDPGGYSHHAIAQLVAQYGELRAMYILRVNLNYCIYEKYGRDHPQFDPKLPYERPKK